MQKSTVKFRFIFLAMIYSLSLNLSTAASKPPIIYKMSVIGIKNKNLIKDFDERSLLKKLKVKATYSVNLIKRRGLIDKKLLEKLLLSYGYYDGTVEYNYNKTDTSLLITFKVNQNKRYHLRDLCIEFVPSHPLIKPPCLLDLNTVGMKENISINSKDILAILNDINYNLGNCGYPEAEIIGHEAVLDPENRKVDMVVRINPGQYYVFGNVRITKPDDIPESFIRNRIPFKTGDTYSQALIDEFHSTLLKSQLFGKISIKPKKKDVVGNQYPINVIVEEALQHTLSAGLQYSTTQGGAITGSWTHRNYSQRADRLQAKAEIGQLEKSLTLQHDLPDFLSPLQSLTRTIELQDLRTDSYKLQGIAVAAILKRPLSKQWNITYGVNSALDSVTRYSLHQYVRSVGLPTSIEYDGRDNILNPTQGGQYKIALTPEAGKIGDTHFILSSILYGSHNLTLDSKKFYGLSAWARYSTITGSDISKVAINKRFYMGGSRSIRGYGYQLAGPVDYNGKPLGGLSTFEYSVEPRVKFTDEWGGVVFYDGGIINNRNTINIKDNRYHGYGFGVRYYTSFGPIRGDVAFPGKRRTKMSNGKKLDAPFQLYISIGQAF